MAHLRTSEFLDAFAKVQKAIVSLVISVFPSVLKVQLGCHCKNFMQFDL